MDDDDDFFNEAYNLIEARLKGNGNYNHCNNKNNSIANTSNTSFNSKTNHFANNYQSEKNSFRVSSPPSTSTFVSTRIPFPQRQESQNIFKFSDAIPRSLHSSSCTQQQISKQQPLFQTKQKSTHENIALSPHKFLLTHKKSTQSGPGSVRPKGTPAIQFQQSPQRDQHIEDHQSHRPSIFREFPPDDIEFFNDHNLLDNHPSVPQHFRPGNYRSSYTTNNIDDDNDDPIIKPPKNLSVTGASISANFPQVTDSEDERPIIDEENIKYFIYPDNLELREYQLAIVQKGFYSNTLVCLPTGLGKTFIAAVIILNYYRWFPTGRIVFMAPTKPLVAQQIEACHQVVGIPEYEMIQMTGTMPMTKRQTYWKTKRIFFVTPQVIKNDIEKGVCPTKSIVLLVIDEAHRAQGNYAYCAVVREVAMATKYFRVVGLSATPGNNREAIQSVIYNLLISDLEARTEDDDDVKDYLHNKSVEVVKVPLSNELKQTRELFLKVAAIVINELVNAHVFYTRNPERVTKGMIFQARMSWRANPPPDMPEHIKAQLEAQFALGISLYHAWSLLNNHGLKSFHNYCSDFQAREREQKVSLAHRELVRTQEWQDLMNLLNQITDMGINHPKLQMVERLLKDHFQAHANDDTRAMVFTEYRDTVVQITELLKCYEPLIRPVIFIGQATGKQTKGLKQREQVEIIKNFREGVFNTLVATCIGEEGLDIGEVDLIICFDAQSSPIRTIQRMGRTGRKREGRCVILVTEGQEQSLHNRVEKKKTTIMKTLLNKAKSNFVFWTKSPRMIPEGIYPEMLKKKIIAEQFHGAKGTPKKKKKVIQSDEKSAVLESKDEFVDKKDWFLSPQEEMTFKTRYALSPTEESHLSKVTFSTSLQKYLNVQATATPTYAIPHTRSTLLLIDSLQFIRQSGFSEQLYHQEMETNLDFDDIQTQKRGVKRSRKLRDSENQEINREIRKHGEENILNKECKNLNEQPIKKKLKTLSPSQRGGDCDNFLDNDNDEKMMHQFPAKVSPSEKYNVPFKEVLNSTGQETSSITSPSFSEKVKKKLAKFCFKQKDEENVHNIDSDISTLQNQPNNSKLSSEQSLVNSEHFSNQLQIQQHSDQQDEEQNQGLLKIQQQNKENGSFSFHSKPNESQLHSNEILQLSTTCEENTNKSQSNAKKFNPSTNNEKLESLHSFQTTSQVDIDDTLRDLDIPLEISPELDNFFQDEQAPQVVSTFDKTLHPPPPEIDLFEEIIIPGISSLKPAAISNPLMKIDGQMNADPSQNSSPHNKKNSHFVATELRSETATTTTTLMQNFPQQHLHPQEQEPEHLPSEIQHPNSLTVTTNEPKDLQNVSDSSIPISFSPTPQPEKKFKRLKKMDEHFQHYQTESTPPQKETIRKMKFSSRRRIIDSDAEDNDADVKGEAEETKLDDEDFLDEGDNHTHNNKTPTLSPTHLNKTITSSSNALVNDIKDFVDDEAEVSDIDGPVPDEPSEESLDDRDEDLEGFVTDQETQPTPPSQSGTIDMNAIYLRSLCSQADIRPANFRSPVPKHPTRFKLRYDLLSKSSALLNSNAHEQSTDPSSPDVPSPHTFPSNATTNEDYQDGEDDDAGSVLQRNSPSKENQNSIDHSSVNVSSCQPHQTSNQIHQFKYQHIDQKTCPNNSESPCQNGKESKILSGVDLALTTVVALNSVAPTEESGNSTQGTLSLSLHKPSPQQTARSFTNRPQIEGKNNANHGKTDLDEDDLFLLAAAEDFSVLDEMFSGSSNITKSTQKVPVSVVSPPPPPPPPQPQR